MQQIFDEACPQRQILRYASIDIVTYQKLSHVVMDVILLEKL